MSGLCHSVQRYCGWHRIPTTIPDPIRFLPISSPHSWRERRYRPGAVRARFLYDAWLGRHEGTPVTNGINRTQSPPKHTSHARHKTYCHGGVGTNPARRRSPIRLTQLHGSQSAPEKGTDFASATRPAHPPPHPLHPPPPKRAKGFEPSTFSLGIIALVE